MNNEEFITTLVSVFPEIKEDILDEDIDGLITLQIGCFRKFTQEAIDGNDLPVIKKCFQFINDNIGEVEYRVENAIYLSFLNKLNFDKNPNAKRLLSKKLLSAKDDLDKYDASKEINVKLNKFLDNL
ncbi:hypothetical protein HDF26_003823 [Pedobacter cryoconitis]|uniref:DUF7674 family protein n=1 Tax=Pedobacter cryoconitis TaxID=188932 RepID=UPI00161B3655|nr:hypothetical protein [Pedobacter cryoconitis]MBB6273363.1 hypothetical protein [Pedobacter cryoconitis]